MNLDSIVISGDFPAEISSKERREGNKERYLLGNIRQNILNSKDYYYVFLILKSVGPKKHAFRQGLPESVFFFNPPPLAKDLDRFFRSGEKYYYYF